MSALSGIKAAIRLKFYLSDDYGLTHAHPSVLLRESGYIELIPTHRLLDKVLDQTFLLELDYRLQSLPISHSFSFSTLEEGSKQT
jgi:hypothetical protein